MANESTRDLTPAEIEKVAHFVEDPAFWWSNAQASGKWDEEQLKAILAKKIALCEKHCSAAERSQPGYKNSKQRREADKEGVPVVEVTDAHRAVLGDKLSEEDIQRLVSSKLHYGGQAAVDAVLEIPS
jgi:hypothetical protein